MTELENPFNYKNNYKTDDGQIGISEYYKVVAEAVAEIIIRRNKMKVRLHNNAEQTAEATDNTIKMLPGGGFLERDENGKIKFDNDGLATVIAMDKGFLKFALKNQGYVKEIIED